MCAERDDQTSLVISQVERGSVLRPSKNGAPGRIRRCAPASRRQVRRSNRSGRAWSDRIRRASRDDLRARTCPCVSDYLQRFGRTDGQACLAAELGLPTLLGRCGGEHPRLGCVANRSVSDEQLRRPLGDLAVLGQCPEIPKIARGTSVMPGGRLPRGERGRSRHTQRRRTGVRINAAGSRAARSAKAGSRGDRAVASAPSAALRRRVAPPRRCREPR
jgi:hypothetical protein